MTWLKVRLWDPLPGEKAREEEKRIEQSEWSEQRIRELVQAATPERADLEFKSGSELNKRRDELAADLSKGVSAMLNANGGVILVGIDEDRSTRSATGLSPVDAVAMPKERLESIILDNIRPKPSQIAIYPVRMGGDHEGLTVYVIQIPPGETAHQARDRKYYRRRNFRAEPMEDYELREVMHRLQVPRLVVHPTIDGVRSPSSFSVSEPTPEARAAERQIAFQIQLIAENLSPALASYAIFDLFFSSGWKSIKFSSKWREEGATGVRLSDGRTASRRFLYVVAPPGHLPLWEGLNVGIEEVSLRASWPSTPAQTWILCRRSAPGAAPLITVWNFWLNHHTGLLRLEDISATLA